MPRNGKVKKRSNNAVAILEKKRNRAASVPAVRGATVSAAPRESFSEADSTFQRAAVASDEDDEDEGGAESDESDEEAVAAVAACAPAEKCTPRGGLARVPRLPLAVAPPGGVDGSKRQPRGVAGAGEAAVGAVAGAVGVAMLAAPLGLLSSLASR